LNIHGTIKIFYTTHKDKWLVNKLLVMCVQHKERPKYDKSNSVHMVTLVKGKTKIGNNAQQFKNESNVSIKHSGKKNLFFFARKKEAYEERLPGYQKNSIKIISYIYIYIYSVCVCCAYFLLNLPNMLD